MDNNKPRKVIIGILLAVLIVLSILYFSGSVTGMVTGFYDTTTTTILAGNETLSLYHDNAGNNDNTTTTMILAGNETTTITVSDGGGTTTVTTSLTTVVTTVQSTTTTTIFQADNDTLGTGNYTCSVNETVCVELWLNTQGAYGAQFTMYYNKSLLSIMQVLNGTYFSAGVTETYWFNMTNNTAVLYGETRINSTEDRAGNGVLAQVLFRCLIDGSDVLGLQDVKVVNYAEEYLNISVVDGFVIVD